MKFSNRIVKFMLDGGMVPAEDPTMQGAPAGAPAEEAPAQGGPDEALQQIAGQLVEMLMQQVGDPAAVQAILEMALQMVGQAAGQAPQEPVYQKLGGKVRRIR